MAVATAEVENSSKKRKRISFAEQAEAAPNPPENVKRVRTESQSAEVAAPVKPTSPDDAPEETPDMWTGILNSAKEKGINYEDAVKDLLIEQLRAVVTNPTDDSVRSSYLEFMLGLNTTFQKLHRYPKIIAKILQCIRNDIIPEHGIKSKSTKKHHGYWDALLFPDKFLAAMAISVSLLPGNHMVELWKTLLHNLDEECISKIAKNEDTAGTWIFLSLLVVLTRNFLESFRVADSIVVSTQSEKIAENMERMRTKCISVLAGALVERDVQEKAILVPFMHLAYSWVELQLIMSLYNTKYLNKLEGTDQKLPVDRAAITDSRFLNALSESDAAGNLACFHPYLSTESWLKLSDKLVNSDLVEGKYLWLRLVLQKLRMLQRLASVIDSVKKNAAEAEKIEELAQLRTRVVAHIKNAVEQVAFQFQQDSDSLYKLEEVEVEEVIMSSCDYLEPGQILSLAKKFIEKKLEGGEDEKVVDLDSLVNIGTNAVFQRIVVQNSVFGPAVVMMCVRNLVKVCSSFDESNRMWHQLNKKVLSEGRIAENLQTLVFVAKSASDVSEFESTLLDHLNKYVSALCSQPYPAGGLSVFQRKLAILKFLSELPVNEYPSRLRNIVFAVITCILVTILNVSPDAGLSHILEKVVILFEKTTLPDPGNAILFKTQWDKVFEAIRKQSSHIPAYLLQRIVTPVLRNLYTSTQLAEGLQPEITVLSGILKDSTNDDYSYAQISANVISQEVLSMLNVKKLKLLKPKLKLVNVMSSHLKELGDSIQSCFQNEQEQQKWEQTISILKTTSCEDVVFDNCKRLTHGFRGCSVLIQAVRVAFAAETLKADVKPLSRLAEITALFEKFMGYALAFLKTFKTKTMKKLLKKHNNVNETKNACLEFVNDVMDVKATNVTLKLTIPEEYHVQLWRICLRGKLLLRADSSIKLDHFPTTIYQTCTVEDFKSIIEVTLEEVNLLGNDEEDASETGENRLQILTFLMDKLIDANLAPEKKNMRQVLWDAYLFAYLRTTLSWSKYEPKTYLAVLDFQLKILRRVNAICSQDALANCFASITAVPLNDLKDSKSFTKAYTKIVDIVNAFAMHRSDVISFRTHLLVQAFKHVIECLAKRADQRSNLSDADIFEYRSCAYALERLCQSIKAEEKHFSRIVPYFLAIMMRQLDGHILYPTIKGRFLNGCYKLLDIADEHAVSQMNTMLTTGAREIFKSTYDFYKKFYKFKGKV